MEKLRTTVTEIAATPDERLRQLPIFYRFFVPIISFSSYLYHLSLNLHRFLYMSTFFPRHRLPVPVISVGNLTWGGNGKTPMVEFIARYLDELGIPPLVLSRGYAGGDEAKMLRRHLLNTSAKVGVGSNRSATAATLFERYGYMDPECSSYYQALFSPEIPGPRLKTSMIGAVILDDGFQHCSLLKDVEVVMINGLSPWGNNYLIPRGSLREPLNALRRAQIVFIHHADLVSHTELNAIVSTVHKISPSIPTFFSRLTPLFLFDVKNPLSKLPLSMVTDMVILCVSAIGCPDAFVQVIKMIGPLHADRLDFSDHHSISLNDINLIRKSLAILQNRFSTKPVVLITEKDYDRNPTILKEVNDFQILVVCSSLQIIPFKDQTEEDFKTNLTKLLLYRCKLGA